MFLRKVKTASGATAVQIAGREGRRDVVVRHLGSAHTDAELAVLMQIGRAKLHEGQGELDLGMRSVATDDRVGVIESQTSRVMIDDEAFFQLVLARLVEPTSIRDTVRVLGELGVVPAHRNTFTATLRRCASLDYRDKVATACFNHAATHGDVSLVLYDATTLYFEAEKEDDDTGGQKGLRKVGYSNYAGGGGYAEVVVGVVVFVLVSGPGWGVGRGIRLAG